MTTRLTPTSTDQQLPTAQEPVGTAGYERGEIDG